MAFPSCVFPCSALLDDPPHLFDTAMPDDRGQAREPLWQSAEIGQIDLQPFSQVLPLDHPAEDAGSNQIIVCEQVERCLREWCVVGIGCQQKTALDAHKTAGFLRR